MSSPSLDALLFLFGLVVGAVAMFAVSLKRFAAERTKVLEAAHAKGKMECETSLLPKIVALEAVLVRSEKTSDDRTKELEIKTQAESRLLAELSEARQEISRISTDLKNEITNAQRRQDDEESLSNRFARLSQEALRTNSDDFIKLAKSTFETEQKEARGELNGKHEAFLNIIKPVGDTMADLKNRVERLSEDKERLADEAKNLSNALRKADVRGRWGEIHLQRVAELAGMHARCDFLLQQTYQNEDDRRRRPDMVVQLPLGRYVVVDSKTVMDAYMSACEATDPEICKALLEKHSKQVRSKIDDLAKTNYAEILGKDGKNVADMIVCFIPGEAFFSAAVANDPFLLEYAAQKQVFLASPTILITLLRAIALGWRDHQRSANADEISNLGKELYSRLSKMQEHFENLGEGVKKSVESYNSMVGSLNSKVFPQARRFKDLGAAEIGLRQKEIRDSRFVESNVHRAQSSDWIPGLTLAAESDDAF